MSNSVATVERPSTDAIFSSRVFNSEGASVGVRTAPQSDELQLDTGRALDIFLETQKLLRKLDNFERMPANWDSYGARRISRAATLNCLKILASPCWVPLEILPFPTVIPTASGYVQFEWHLEEVDIELYADETGTCHVLFEDMTTGECQDWHSPINQALNKLAQFTRQVLKK